MSAELSRTRSEDLGVVMQDVRDDSRPLPHPVRTFDPAGLECMWIVGRREPITRQEMGALRYHLFRLVYRVFRLPTSARYHITGIAENERMAVAMCTDEFDFIGPLPVNSALPKERVEWPGHYFPYRVHGRMDERAREALGLE